jgi:hypothetical protein
MKINKRYGRVGHLFEGVYKARMIKNDYDLVNLSRYIHLNPGSSFKEVCEYPYSSLRCYLKEDDGYPFVDTELILDICCGTYENYIREGLGEGQTLFRV